MSESLPKRSRPHRLEGYDYSSPGAYFVTVATKERICLFDDTRLKRVASETWRWLGEHFTDVAVDEFVVMPNHLHGILILNAWEGALDVDRCRCFSREAPTADRVVARAKPLGQLVGAFKAASTAEVNRLLGTPGAQLWQRNFHDRVVRSDAELERIRKYIYENPAMWDQDPENPERSYVESSIDRIRL